MGEMPEMIEFRCQMQRSRSAKVASGLANYNSFVMHEAPRILQFVSFSFL